MPITVLGQELKLSRERAKRVSRVIVPAALAALGYSAWLIVTGWQLALGVHWTLGLLVLVASGFVPWPPVRAGLQQMLAAYALWCAFERSHTVGFFFLLAVFGFGLVSTVVRRNERARRWMLARFGLKPAADVTAKEA